MQIKTFNQSRGGFGDTLKYYLKKVTIKNIVCDGVEFEEF